MGFFVAPLGEDWVSTWDRIDCPFFVFFCCEQEGTEDVLPLACRNPVSFLDTRKKYGKRAQQNLQLELSGTAIVQSDDVGSRRSGGGGGGGNSRVCRRVGVWGGCGGVGQFAGWTKEAAFPSCLMLVLLGDCPFLGNLLHALCNESKERWTMKEHDKC